MIKMTHHITQEVFCSEVRPDISTTYPALGPLIAWADKNPHAWKIVTTNKSKAFGLGSCVYIGWAQRSTSPEAILERLRHLHELVTAGARRNQSGSIFIWRAQFTFEHFNDKGFKGGFFQQFDGRYPRSCLTLDYTPETLELVLDRFCEWMDRHFETMHITLNGRVIRTFK